MAPAPRRCPWSSAPTMLFLLVLAGAFSARVQAEKSSQEISNIMGFDPFAGEPSNPQVGTQDLRTVFNNAFAKTKDLPQGASNVEQDLPQGAPAVEQSADSLGEDFLSSSDKDLSSAKSSLAQGLGSWFNMKARPTSEPLDTAIKNMDLSSLHSQETNGDFSGCKAKKGIASVLGRRLTSERRLGAFGFDPLKWTTELAVTALVVVILGLLITHKKQVLLLLTGDDRIHATLLDCVWFSVFKCCGFCTWEWTRNLSWLPCCPKRWKGTNLVKTCGTELGFATRSIEVSNLVVGDIPCYRHASFYLTVECAQNPPMTTALQEDKDPKVIHFPEVLTLKIRDSSLEDNVVFTLRLLEVFGSKKICEVRIPAKNISDWAQDPEGQSKRFAMVPHNRDIEVETPPWISCDFGEPTLDVRDLEHFHGNHTMTVRTATWGEIDGTTNAPWKETGMADFKGEYKLVDNAGNLVEEPDETDLGSIHCFRLVLKYSFHILNVIVGLSLTAYAGFRYYVRNCYLKYRDLAIAKRWKGTPMIAFPAPICALRSLEAECHKMMAGTGIKAGDHYCRPADKDIDDTCLHPPKDQNRPLAFQYILEDLQLDSYYQGYECSKDICTLRAQLIETDYIALGAAAGLLFFVCCLLPPLGNKCLQSRKRSLQASRNRNRPR